MLISQSRNNILEFFQSLKLTTHQVLLTGALGTLQEAILHTPGLHKKPTFANAYISVMKQHFQGLPKPRTNYSSCTSD